MGKIEEGREKRKKKRESKRKEEKITEKEKENILSLNPVKEARHVAERHHRLALGIHARAK